VAYIHHGKLASIFAPLVLPNHTMNVNYTSILIEFVPTKIRIGECWGDSLRKKELKSSGKEEFQFPVAGGAWVAAWVTTSLLSQHTMPP
jgi:hypothetical protein